MRLLTILSVAVVFVAGCQPPPPPPRIITKAEVNLRPIKEFKKKLLNPTPPEQESVYAVLEADAEAYKQATTGIPSEAQPSALLDVMQKYCDAVEKIDTTACPPDFRSAFKYYSQACRQLAESFRKLPDEYRGTSFNDALASLYKGETSKGQTLGGDVMKAVTEMSDTCKKLYSTSEQYGIQVDR